MNTVEPPVCLDIAVLRSLYKSGELTPRELLNKLDEFNKGFSSHNIWIHYLSSEERESYLSKLEESSIDSLPLYGVPFAIKDNIALKGIRTTAGNKHLNLLPTESAFVVQKLIEAGAIPIGKTNLDQFATGLNGTRSDFGACRNAVDSKYVSGGSSSGSAVAVALGLVSFSLGTDTAGSGRVPAALNNIVGLKPTLGRLSVEGLIPACLTIDCISIFGRSAEQSNLILSIADAFNPKDAWQKEKMPPLRLIGESFVFGVPSTEYLQFPEYPEAEKLFATSVEALEDMGGRSIEIDFAPFCEAAALLYDGPWVNERQIAIDKLISDPSKVNETVRKVLSSSSDYSAYDAFASFYRLKELKRICDNILTSVDFIVTPTTPGPFTIEDMEIDPVTLNSRLGAYTNFVNMLDYSAIAIPSGFLDNSMPWGITLFGPAWSDTELANLAGRYHSQTGTFIGATNNNLEKSTVQKSERTIDVAVCGAHLDGLPLNWQLRERGAVRIKEAKTASCYNFYVLDGGPPFRPGLVRSPQGGGAIDVEIWRISEDQFGSFVSEIPHPLGIGQVELSDGNWATSFICEPCGIEGAQEITGFKSWKKYIASIS